MSVLNLERIFSPRTIAVVCGFEQSGSTGMAVMHNLAAGGFTGHIYPVLPHCHGLIRAETYKSIRELPEPVDLAIIVSPINAVAEIVAECATMGVGGAVVIPPGGSPPFKLNRLIQEQILETIAGSEFRVLWSDALGIISTREKLNAGLAQRMPKIGNTAFITQSGAIGEAILDFAAKEHIGFSHFISLGAMLDVDFGDLVDFLGSDPHVNSIVIYMENLTRVRNFMSAARAVSRIKPIIVLKAGRTAAGAAAAVTHTGALTSEDAVYDAAFKRSGIVRVKTFAELFDCVEFIGKQPGPKGHGLAIVTNAGGSGVMAVDALWDYGVSPALLTAETIEKLNGFLPSHWSRANPVDILDDATPERYAMTVDILMNAREVDGLLIMLVPHQIAEPARTAHDLADLLKKQSFPVFMAWLGGSEADAGRAVFNNAGIPTLDSPERAVRAFMDLYHYSRNIETLQQIPKKLPDRLNFDRDTARRLINTGLARGNGLLTEIEAKQLLISYGISVNIAEPAADAEHAVRIAENIGFPVAMKVNSTGIVHKSQAGGVVLDITNAEGVREAYDQIRNNTAAVDIDDTAGISVQKMLPRGDFELIAGARKDENFGPVLLFGLGGVLAEELKDRSIALPPLNRLLARRMIEDTRIYKVLNSHRNYKDLDVVQIETLLIRLSQLVTDFAEISEIDINPLAIIGDRVVALDARVIVNPTEMNAPLHLAISPYPNQYEEEIVIEGVGCLTLRPIRPEDAPLLEGLFDSLSQQSVYYRFFNLIRRLPHHMLAKYTQIDYDREIAMVAISSSGALEKMLGVSRVIASGNRKSAEFAVVVADQWHGKGIGAVLLERCLDYARTKNIETIWAVVLPGNTKMLAMAKKMGFEIKYHHGRGEYELKLDLRYSSRAPIPAIVPA